METGYWNFPDGEHFSTSGSVYGQSLIEDSKHSLLDIDMLSDDFATYESVQQFERNEPDIWDTETELNGDIAVLPLAISKLECHSKEDFHQVLSDWQEHVGSMQASDTEDMDVKDIVGMDIAMPRNFSEHLAESIFEETSLDSQVKTWQSSGESHNSSGQAFLTTIVKEEYNFDLENFLDCDENCDDDDDNIGLTVVEDDVQDTRSREDSCLEFQEECEGIFGNVELPIMQPVKVVKEVGDSKKLFPEYNSEKMNEMLVPEIRSDMDTIVTVKDELEILEFEDQEFGEDSLGDVVEDTEVKKVEPEVLPKPVTVKSEENEDCIDVETVSEQMPVLEAGDLKSLLEQFEASEAVNSTGPTGKQSVLDSHLFAMATQQPSTPANSPKSTTVGLSHQNIKDSLPKEVIDRIKASGRKKVIPVIPAMPTKKAGRAATRMQDAGAALSRNKLLKIVSGNAGGESVQLDHDYCCSSGDSSPTKSFYHSDASEYCGKNVESVLKKTELFKDNTCSRLPDYIVLAPQAKNMNRTRSKDEECWEKNAKKDSGLESGDVSDASEETITPPGSVFTPIRSFPELNETWKKTQSSMQGAITDVSNVLSVNGKDINLEAMGVNVTGLSKVSAGCKTTQSQIKTREITMVSVLKKCQATPASPITTVVSSAKPEEVNNVVSNKTVVAEEPRETKKRKINLEQYRSRLKEMDKVRPGDVSALDPFCVNSASVDPCAPASVGEEKDGGVESERTSSEVADQASRPNVCSVEIQAQLDCSNSLPLEADKEKKTERSGRSRDRRHQQFRSRRASTSSSSASSSSSSSSSSRKSRSSRRHADTHSRRRRRRSKRNSSGSTSGTRSHKFWSRSRSSSHSSSYSSSSSRSRSRSRSRRSHSKRRSKQSVHLHPGRRNFQNWRPAGDSFHGWRRSRSPVHNICKNIGEWPLSEREKLRQVEERRVVYVGRIDEGTTKADLRRRFEIFGHIVDISVHFREHGDNYGFVTFQYKDDAYNAVEHGNDDPNVAKFDLCFGGRRAFCKTRYADLDGIATYDEDLAVAQNAWKGRSRPHNENSFDLLLREAQAKLRKRNV